MHIYGHEENVALLSEAVRSLVRDPSPAVRAMAIRTLSAMMRHRPQQAVELFVELSLHRDDRILAGRDAHEFLRFAGARYFTDLRPVIERMVESANSAVRMRGAVQAALAALDEAAAHPLAERCLLGDPALRLGVAQVVAANLTNATFRARCEDEIVGMFEDDDAEVRKAAVQVWRELADEDFADSDRLVDAFLKSPAFDPAGATALLQALDLAQAPPPVLSLRACGAVLDAGFGSADAVGGSVTLHELGELSLRAYADAADLSGRNAALDVIDRMLELDSFRFGHALSDYER